MRTLKRGMKRFHIVALIIVFLISPLALWTLRDKALANNTAQTLPFTQNWTNIGLITANDDWSGVPGIEGFFLRNDAVSTTGVDPQTILGDTFGAGTTTVELDVIANQTNPNTLANGGVAEFHITDPVVALNGSGTADAPFVLIHLNTTGKTNITVSYNLRDIDGSADNAVQPVALHFRVGSSGSFTNIAAAFVADATTGPSQATQVTPVSVMLPAAAENQPLVQLRIMTTNAVGNDEWVGIDDISIDSVGAGQPVVPTCPASISTTTGTPASANVSATDADGTVTSAMIQSITPSDPGTIMLNNFMPAAGVGGTATAMLDVGAATPPGNYSVTIRWSNNDMPPQTADCTVAVMVASPPVKIHDIQGNGNISPLVSTMVTTTGIVTGVKNNGFFIQEPDAMVDADPATSEGIFVFTSSAPPAAAVVGNLVQVSGMVAEFIPSADPFSPPLTEITLPMVSVLSMGNPLPAPIPLTTTFPDPAAGIDQLERLEGMRVSAGSLTIVHPTSGNINEPNATSTSNGVFYGVITGVARPFREPGIQAPDPPPSGMIPPIPRFDANPERIRVDSDGLTGSPAIDVATGAVVTGLVGPLDYAFRTYTILPDPGISPGVSGGLMAAIPCPVPAANEFTVASFNMQRFYDTVDNPGGDTVITPTAFNNRLNKASLAIRNVMRTPDVIGVEEVENLTTLQAIATKINNDAVAASQPDPMYQAFLSEGNDPGGIDVGFLVKTARVMVVDVMQIGLTDTYINPNNGMPEILNDRPPLVLRASIDGFAFTVIVNHLRSLNGIDDAADGNRVRTKRRAQAEFLANLIQTRQMGDPMERIVSVGDYNAFQFNDGYVDLIGTIKGTPTPMGEAVLTSPDLVNPDLTDLIDMAVASERYSFLFDGNAQSLDHELITSNLLARFSQICYARCNADFPEILRNDPNRPERVSDHDMSVAYFTLPCEIECPANISVSNDTAQCGAIVDFSIMSTNCSGVTCSPPSGSFFPVGTTTVTCSESAPMSASEEIKASLAAVGSSCSFTVTVNDTQNPAVTCPENISETTMGTSAVVNFTATVMDNCPGAMVSCDPASGSSFPLGITTVTCAAVDASGNQAICSFTVTIAQECAITCPANITVNNAPGQCAATVTFSPMTAGSCGTVSCAPASGSSFPVGTTTVTCTTTAGPSCSFTVTVNDTEAPQISCAPLTIVGVTPTPGGSCAVVNYAPPTATDNCSGVTVACTPPSGSCFPVGTTTINCTATDASGNMSSTAVSCPGGGSGISVVVFDICLQDDSNAGRVLLFNSQTGDYVFCCGGVQFSGKGVITRKGNTISLSHFSSNPSRRVTATVTIGGVNKGEATLQSPSGTTICTIKDSNILNNSCACGGTT